MMIRLRLPHRCSSNVFSFYIFKIQQALKASIHHLTDVKTFPYLNGNRCCLPDCGARYSILQMMSHTLVCI